MPLPNHPLPRHTGQSGAPALDRSQLVRVLGMELEDEPELLRALIDLFLEQLPISVACIDLALAEGDADQAKISAHTLRGSSGSLGLVALQQLCTEIEALAAAHNLAGLLPLRGPLQTTAQAGRAALEALRPAA